MFWRKKPKTPSDLELIVEEMGRSRSNVAFEGHYDISCSLRGFNIWLNCDGGCGARFNGERIELTRAEHSLINKTLSDMRRSIEREKQTFLRSKIAPLTLELQKANEQKLLTELAECRARIKASEGA